MSERVYTVTIELTATIPESTLSRIGMSGPDGFPVRWWESELKQKLNESSTSSLCNILSNVKTVNCVYLDSIKG